MLQWSDLRVKIAYYFTELDIFFYLNSIAFLLNLIYVSNAVRI